MDHLVVDGGQLFVGGFQFFLRGFQFFIDALQFLVGGGDFFVRRLEFFVGCLVLLLEGLGVVALLGQFAFEFGDAAGFGSPALLGLAGFGRRRRPKAGLLSLMA